MTSESTTTAPPGWGPLLVISSLLSLSVVALHSRVGCGSRIWCGNISARSSRLGQCGSPLYSRRGGERMEVQTVGLSMYVQHSVVVYIDRHRSERYLQT